MLNIDPTNSIAQAYNGYILKVYDNDLEKGVIWMKKGVKSSDGTVNDPKY